MTTAAQVIQAITDECALLGLPPERVEVTGRRIDTAEVPDWVETSVVHTDVLDNLGRDGGSLLIDFT